jgi:hypothetical protein
MRSEATLRGQPRAPETPSSLGTLAVGEPLVFRELTAPSEAVALLRLRHRVYFEERGYGSPKPFGLDLTVCLAASVWSFGVSRPWPPCCTRCAP